VASLKILGVTISNKLSVSEHVQQTVSQCEQSFHALRILRNHGMELGSQCLTTGLQVRPSWQDDLRRQCLVGLHHGCWQAAFHFAVLFVLVSTQQMDQTCISWSLTWMMLFLCEYRRMNSMYYNNCYPPLPVINMFYTAKDMTILLAVKQTMMIVILLLVCYTRTYTDRFLLFLFYLNIV